MKSMREVDLDTYSLSLLTAKEDILNPRSSTNWALFAYDGIMNRLKLADSGVGGLKELTGKLHPRRPLYGMCRVGKAQPRIAMILWVGNEVDEYRRAECASHLPAIRAFFKEVHIFLPAHTLDEITEERICTLAYSATAVTQGPRGRPGRRTEDRQAIVGTNYKRTIAAAEIQRIQRDSFWAQAEREEEERKKEEQRRAAEDRRQREKERFLQERRDAIERERRMNEKEQKIKEQRRIQAQMEAEARKVDKMKWEHEEREREEEEIRARYSRSQSEEKAAEAAALVSQRTVNPREIFRQLSSSSVHTPSSPTCPVRSPYRRLRRSQTDNIFSFNESPSSTPTSPYRSSVVSPNFPSSPTSRSPILFTSTTTSSLQNGAMLSTKSQIQKMMEPLFQTQPSPSADAIESEIKTHISDILDSLVFYPPPPTPEQLQPDVSEIEDEFPPPPPGFDNSPEPSVNQPETLDEALDPLLPPSCVLVPEPPTRPLPALPVSPRMLTDLELERDFTARASVISTVEEEEDEGSEEKKNEEMDGEKGGGKERAETGEMQNRGQEEHDGMTMEKHESEKESNGKMMEKYESGKEQDGKMLEECESEEKQDGNVMEEREREEEKVGEIVKEFESGKIMKEQESEKIQHQTMRLECVLEKEQNREIIEKHEKDGKDLEEDENEKIMEEHEQDGKIVDAFDNEKEQDKKSMEVSETETLQYAKIMEVCGQENEQNRKMEERCEEEHESEKENGGKMMEELEVEKIRDGNIMEKHESVKIMKKHEQDGKIVDAFDNEQDKKSMEASETEKSQYARMMEECGEENWKIAEEHESEKEIDGKMMEEHGSKEKQDGGFVDLFDNEKEQHKKCMETSETEKIQDPKIMEECGQEIEQNWKFAEKCEEEHEREKEHAGEIMKEHEVEKIQDGNIMEEHESERQENEQDGKNVEKCEEEYKSEKEFDGKMTEEHGNKDGKIVDSSDSDKQDETNMEVFETEKLQNAPKMEECGQENEQNKKIVEEHLKEHDSEKIHDGDFIEEHECEKEDWKVVEVFETEKIQYVKVMEACEQENKQCEEEHESEKEDVRRLEEQDWKIMEVFESEKEQDCKIGERHEDGKSLEAQEGEKDEDWKMTENCKSEKIQYENIMKEREQDGTTENQQDSENQDNEEMPHMDVDKAVNVTVLKKEESYTEIMKRDMAIAESVEELKSDKENEKEQTHISLIQTDKADTVFSQHAPLFPESHATEPSQVSVPESISTTQDKNEPQMSSTDTSPQINLPTIQVESDFSRLCNQRDSDVKEKTESVDSQASSENSQDATSAEQTPGTEKCAAMLQEDKIVVSRNDLAEGIDAECQTSPIAGNRARIGQLDEGEGLAPVSHFSEDSDSAVDLKHCITHQLERTDDISDDEEGEEATSLLASDTDVEQNLKCDSEPDQANEDIKYESLQKCETIAETPSGMRNDKIADEK